jgi:hypothetical protein
MALLPCEGIESKEYSYEPPSGRNRKHIEPRITPRRETFSNERPNWISLCFIYLSFPPMFLYVGRMILSTLSFQRRAGRNQRLYNRRLFLDADLPIWRACQSFINDYLKTVKSKGLQS